MSDPYTVFRQGNVLVIRTDDGEEFRALSVGIGVWEVIDQRPGLPPDPAPEEPGDPEPNEPEEPDNVFRYPFPVGQHTTYAGHSGMDWGGGRVGNTADVKAVGPGTVVAVYNQPANTFGQSGGSNEPQWRGHCVVINHGVFAGNRVWSLYAHLREAPTLAVGATVAGGQVIGRVGNTGYSNGAHLHFEIIFNGVRLRTGQGGYERARNWMAANATGTW